MWFFPAAIISQVFRLPTLVGSVLPESSPVPNCPWAMAPQAQSVPFCFIAIAWSFPADTLDQSLSVPIRVGEGIDDGSEPPWPI